jgi:hypothetical protein
VEVVFRKRRDRREPLDAHVLLEVLIDVDEDPRKRSLPFTVPPS